MSVEIRESSVNCEGIEVLVSSRPWELEIDTFIEAELIDLELPVLDVGGGGSSVTASLLRQGYDAYALDPLYESRETALRVINGSFLGIAMGAMISDSEDDLNEQTESFSVFKKSLKRKPDRYIGESILESGLEDDFFGTVISSASVESYLAKSPDIFEIALREMARITAPDGRIIMTTGLIFIPPEALGDDSGFADLETAFGREAAIYLSQQTQSYGFEKALNATLANQRTVIDKLLAEGVVEPVQVLRHFYNPKDKQPTSTSLVLRVI